MKLYMSHPKRSVNNLHDPSLCRVCRKKHSEEIFIPREMETEHGLYEYHFAIAEYTSKDLSSVVITIKLNRKMDYRAILSGSK